MNGIKLKSEKVSPLVLERIKWIILLFLSHLLVLLLTSSKGSVKVSTLPILQEGHVRLSIPLESQIPEGQAIESVILMTADRGLVSKSAKLLKKLPKKDGLNSTGEHFLVEIPESDLNKLVQARNKKLLAYPASKDLNFLNNIKRRKIYEILF